MAAAQQAGWGNLGKKQAEVFSWTKWWTEPLFGGFWMAWTRATMAFFIFAFAAIALLAVLEWRWPGGHERNGILGLATTRGDRLFIGLLGSAYIFLGWLALPARRLGAAAGGAVAGLLLLEGLRRPRNVRRAPCSQRAARCFDRRPRATRQDRPRPASVGRLLHRRLQLRLVGIAQHRAVHHQASGCRWSR